MPILTHYILYHKKSLLSTLSYSKSYILLQQKLHFVPLLNHGRAGGRNTFKNTALLSKSMIIKRCVYIIS